jgi:5-methylcytosine-specific restriction enzyme A
VAGLKQALDDILSAYPTERTREFAENDLARFIREDLRSAVDERVIGDSYLVVGSPGRGNWAETPWVSVFDTLVTDTAQRGYYVVYLFRADGGCVYLSLNQGTTEVHDLVGASYREALRDKARSYAGLLGARVRGLLTDPLDLGGRGWLSKGYEAGNVAAVQYVNGSVPHDQILDGTSIAYFTCTPR